jgi:hypothetical protein
MVDNGSISCAIWPDWFTLQICHTSRIIDGSLIYFLAGDPFLLPAKVRGAYENSAEASRQGHSCLCPCYCFFHSIAWIISARTEQRFQIPPLCGCTKGKRPFAKEHRQFGYWHKTSAGLRRSVHFRGSSQPDSCFVACYPYDRSELPDRLSKAKCQLHDQR